MIDLKKLTVAYIDKLAKECNIKFKSSINKAAKINKILNSGIPDSKLEMLYNKYLAQYQASKRIPKVDKKKPVKQVGKLEERVNLLEEKFKFLMSKIDNIDILILLTLIDFFQDSLP